MRRGVRLKSKDCPLHWVNCSVLFTDWGPCSDTVLFVFLAVTAVTGGGLRPRQLLCPGFLRECWPLVLSSKSKVLASGEWVFSCAAALWLSGVGHCCPGAPPDGVWRPLGLEKPSCGLWPLSLLRRLCVGKAAILHLGWWEQHRKMQRSDSSGLWALGSSHLHLVQLVQ